MTIRSPPLFVASLLLLAASTTLGAVLVHDGEIGTDAARIAHVAPGDSLRLKGVLEPFTVPATPDWAPVAQRLHDTTYRLHVDQSDAFVLVTGAPDDLAGDMVVDAAVLLLGADDLPVLLEARAVQDPFFAW